jgi:hypothetical protein
MQFLDSLLFLLILLVLLWSIKADLFFVVFGFAILLFFLIELFFMQPLEILLSIINFMFLNPTGFILLFIPFIIAFIKHVVKKNLSRNKSK